MSTFIMSDIHGQYNAYKKMLEKINFSDEDELYVLGDVIDRGPDGIRIIKDLMERPNAELILGNHEFMLLNAIQFLKEREAGKVKIKKTDDGLTPFELWTHPCNGGEGTCLEFLGLAQEERDSIEEYLRGLRLIKRIKIGKQTYHLSHSYSLKRQFGKELLLSKVSHKTAEEIVWESLFDRIKPGQEEHPFAYEKDIYIVGHIFTQRLEHMDKDGKGMIFTSEDYRGYHVIDVDCGMALNSRSSRLGCLCLDTREEYYVPLLED